MTIAILLVTHRGIGSALQTAALQMMGGTLPVPVEVIEVPGNADTDMLRDQAHALLNRLGDSVLVMTDIYGSTPANIAVSLGRPAGVSVITGVNLPMLVRALNYAQEPLADVTDKALEGGLRSIFLAKSAEH